MISSNSRRVFANLSKSKSSSLLSLFKSNSRSQAKTLQSSLAALSEKIDLVKEDHAKLESENRALQDYIGGLTRTISGNSNLGRSSSLSAKKKGKR